MVSISYIDFTPYKTFYEKYLQYPIFEPRERPDKDGPRLIPNNLGLDLSSYPVKPVGRFYQECFNNLINSMNILNQFPGDREEIQEIKFDFFYYMQIFFEGISELRFYERKRPNYYIFPTILESLVKTKLNFDVYHFMDKLLNSTPFVLNIPNREFSVADSKLGVLGGINKLAIGEKPYISSILVDFLPATEVLTIFKNIGPASENSESLKNKYLLTLNLWTSPMPINKHPGEIRSDTVCFLLDSKESVASLIDGSAFSKYAGAVIETTSADLSLDANISSISSNTILNLLRAQSLTSYQWCMDFVGPDLLQKILSLVITSSMLISDKSEWIKEIELPSKPITPSIQFLPESDPIGRITHPKYHNRAPCPCFRGQGRKPFMHCCKPRLKAITLEPNDNFTVGAIKFGSKTCFTIASRA